MSYLFLIMLFVSSAWAKLETIQIKNLDLQYLAPYGSGELEKLSLGISLVEAPRYPVEIFRRDNSFEITSPFVTFEWLRPYPFVHNMKEISVKTFFLLLGEKEHHMKGENLVLTMENGLNLVLNQFDFNCAGPSVFLDPIERIKEDCIQNLSAQAKKIELPFDIVKSVSNAMPDEDTDALDMPADDFSLSIDKGQFSGSLKIKILFKAYLKFRGFIHHDLPSGTTAIRMDSVKFGVLPVTSIVFKVLKEQIKDPRIKIDPPWIRISQETNEAAP